MLDLVEQTVTVSFWAKAGANYSGGSLSIKLSTGTTADQSAGTFSAGPCTGYTGNQAAINTTQAITTTFTKYTFTSSAIQAGALSMGLGIGYTPTGTAGADDNVYITGVQLEKGSTATSFDYRPYGTELQLCYRYYYFLGGETAYQNINTCVWYGAGDAVGQFSYPVAMRANPTMAKSGTWATLGGGGAVAQTLSNDQITTKNVQLGFTGGSGGTSGQATTLRASNDTGLRLTFSAEL